MIANAHSVRPSLKGATSMAGLSITTSCIAPTSSFDMVAAQHARPAAALSRHAAQAPIQGPALALRLLPGSTAGDFPSARANDTLEDAAVEAENGLAYLILGIALRAPVAAPGDVATSIVVGEPDYRMVEIERQRRFVDNRVANHAALDEQFEPLEDQSVQVEHLDGSHRPDAAAVEGAIVDRGRKILSKAPEVGKPLIDFWSRERS